MSKYFRATGYYPKENISFIIDSNGKFAKRWELGSFLVCHNCKVIAINDYEQIKDTNLQKSEVDNNHLIIRAMAKGEPKQTTYGNIKTLQINTKTYKI